MVVEYIRYGVPRERSDEFESAWAKAQMTLGGAPECLAYEVDGIEEPEHYIVRIE